MKDNYLYIIGDFQDISNTKTNKISVFSMIDCSFVKYIEIGDSKHSLHQIVVNKESNQIYASGAVFVDVGKEVDWMTDSVFIHDMQTHSTQRIDLYGELDDGKEGGLGNIVYNKLTNTIYASLVYAQGGNKSLFIVNKDKAIEKKSIKMPRYGPLGLELNPITNLLYVLGTDTNGSYIVEIDCIKETERRRITLPFEITHINPYNKFQELTIDTKRNKLYVIGEGKLYRIDLNNKMEIESILTHGYEFNKIIYNYSSDKLYAIAQVNVEVEDINKNEFLLVIVDDNIINPQFRIGLEVESIFIPNSSDVVCLSCLTYLDEHDVIRKVFFFRELEETS